MRHLLGPKFTAMWNTIFLYLSNRAILYAYSIFTDFLALKKPLILWISISLLKTITVPHRIYLTFSNIFLRYFALSGSDMSNLSLLATRSVTLQ
jgi:hypothetical protein